MPTISEPIDQEIRTGRAASVLEYWSLGMLGEATAVASLRILRYEPEDIRYMMEQEKQRWEATRRSGARAR